MSKADGDHLLRQNLTRDYPRIVRGEGPYLIDDSGRRIIDGASGGVGPCNIGHGVPQIIEAMTEQASTLAFAHISMYESEPQIALANMLCDELAPSGMAKAYFTSTGTEANELAIKAARLYHLCRGEANRYHVISLWSGYHGSSIAATAYSGRTQRRHELHPYFFPATHVEPPYCYQCPFGKTHPECGLTCATALDRAIERIGPRNVSCFIAEPIGNTMGCVAPPDEYWPAVRRICDRHGVVMIADEVITGFGRTGTTFAMDHWNTVPDLIATGKGISSGYAPLAATLFHERIWETLDEAKRSLPGFTYGGNPLSCAVGLAAQQYIRDNDLVARSAELGAYMHQRARKELGDLAIVGQVRGGRGLYMGIEYVRDKGAREPFPARASICARIGDLAFEKGLATCPISGGVNGEAGDVTVVKPPFTMPREEIDRLIEIIGSAIREVSTEEHM